MFTVLGDDGTAISTIQGSTISAAASYTTFELYTTNGISAGSVQSLKVAMISASAVTGSFDMLISCIRHEYIVVVMPLVHSELGLIYAFWAHLGWH